MGGLTPLEAAALLFILEEAPENAPAWQFAAAEVTRRTNTGACFMTELAVPAEVPPAAVTGVLARVEGLQHGLGFVLFLKDGRITTVLPLEPTGGVFRLTTARVTLPSGRGFEGGGPGPDLTMQAARGSVAARLQASREGANGARREPSPAPAWPELEAALSRAGAPPADAPADAARPETDPEGRRAHGLLLALHERPSSKP